jgi:hypothetical protein
VTFRIRTIDQTAAGREIVRERELAQDSLTIGRAAECDLHLPDLAIEQRHLRVSQATGGQLRIEAIGTLGFTLDGRAAREATVSPREGHELELGSYRLELMAGDGTVAVTVRQAQDRERRTDATRGFALAGALPGKRGVAWLSLVVILLAFLAVPIYSHLTRVPTKPSIDHPGAVVMDASWSPGALSDPHHALETNCEACHVKAFVAVRDNACLACHSDIGNHAEHAKLLAARGPMNWGEGFQRAVATVFNKPGPGACIDCHTEHQGAGRMAPTQQKFCADCHATLDRRLNDTAIGNAADFGDLHPQFAALIETSPNQSKPVRVSLDARPKEWDGLRFPHALHLDPRGGVARMASNIGAEHGYGRTLDCKDCHHPTADGVRFLPVDMERDCEACHSLAYDKVGATFRTLRHGDIAQMQADLIADDRSPRRPIVTGRRRPGDFAPGGTYFSNFTGGSAAVAAAMSTRGVCGECHVPTSAGGPLGVMPVLQHSRYFAHGWFDHATHQQENCASCHAAKTSNRSTDLLLPGISRCRDCHLGENSRKAKVPSGCVMCHSYHPRQGAPAKAGLVALRDGE